MTETITYYPTPVRSALPTPKRLHEIFTEENVHRRVETTSFTLIPECAGLVARDGIVEIGLLHVARLLDEKTAATELFRLGFLPRTYTELIDFSEAHFDLVRVPIVPLASKVIAYGHSSYACAWGDPTRPPLLVVLESVKFWSPDCRFLVTPR